MNLKTFIQLSVATLTVASLGTGCSSGKHETASKNDHAGHTAPAEEQAPGEIKPVKVGKYQVELWVPEEGLFSGEEVDVEFGVFDSTKEDPQLGGMLGIDCEAAANVTMPAMEGMPAQKPKIHKEGRAGVQGLELFFPHGGEYQIDLTITPKGDKPIKASFKVPVGDARPAKTTASKAPYELQVVDWNEHTMPGTAADLKMRVVDTKTGQPVTSFDIAHEKKFHLLLASKNLKQFMHEHPEMAADGTWTHHATFPAGGEWYVYGDVAPTGKGGRVLIAKINVHGEEPAEQMYVEGFGPATREGLTGKLELPKTVEVGKMSEVVVRLTDAKTGKPVSDLKPYLGAAGHLMIISEDGQTVVHSHPEHSKEAEARVNQGVVSFNARFPKPGRYVAYAQFNRGGVKTLGFSLTVGDR